MISIYCVGFASLDVVCDKLNDSHRGRHLVNPFATLLFSGCSPVTVECCDSYPCCVGVFGMFAVM